ncbi:MAG: Crp/Fnr family transcriptional regulator [Alphaproteobacteria bacterium]|nr:Crp/Fnr family transcriptional regulator [Alphaproteobacteria bacterium]
MGSSGSFYGLSALSPDEIDVISRSLHGDVRRMPAGIDIVLADESVSNVFLVRSGWLASYTILEDGRRQITRFWREGDQAGLGYAMASALGVKENGGPGDFVAPNGCVSVTPVEVEVIAPGRIRALVEEHPKLALKYFTIHSMDHNEMLVRHLTSVGRQSAHEALAALILELARREGLHPHAAKRMTVALPLNQTVVADALGLTSVHISRVLADFEKRGLIERQATARAEIVVRDLAGLVETADMQPYRDWLERTVSADKSA